MRTAVELAVLDRNNQLVFDSARSSAVISNLLALILAANTAGTTPVPWLVSWLAGGVFIALLRVRVARTWRASAAAQREREAARWRSLAIRGALAAGLWWALGTAVTMSSATTTARFFLGMLLSGLVAGALLSLTAIPAAYRQFSLPPIFAYLVASVLSAQSRGEWLMIPAIGLFVPVLVRGSKQVSEMMNRNIRLATEQATLVLEVQGARDSALASARARSEFLAVMSHEIRTPLNGVVGMTGLLRETDLTAEQIDFAETLGQSAQALQGIIDDILDFSKIDAGRVALEQRDVELPAELKSLVRLMGHKASEKNLTVELECAPTLTRFVKADWGRLRQVLVNLLGNAIKFTGEGRVRCLVSEGPEGVRFEVSDTGIGIDPAQLSRLFEPFTQADASISRRFGGTGLGLSISRRIVQLMGGDITVSSTAGVGSSFVFTLRLAPGQAPAVEAPVAITTRPASVLLVDDNEINLKLERVLLERAGHAVQVARDGEEALACLAVARFDLVLLDLQMPVLDGFQTARRVRDPASAVLDHLVPIVALTANATVEDREACARAGFSDYLTKPVAPRALWAAVARWQVAPRPGAGAGETPRGVEGPATSATPDSRVSAEGPEGPLLSG